ncbi:MAG TPA: hypothetical protein VGM84_24910 [Steroidobacteraceae bacterium]|jgi:hypothetical protein
MRSASVRAAVAAAVVVSVPLAFAAFGDEPASAPDHPAAVQAPAVVTPTPAPAIIVLPSAAHTVYLYTSADLDQLRQTNPRHYSRVQKILANASESLCRPGALRLQHAEGLNAEDAKCAAGLEMTSNPPKRQLSFRLDDTTYIAVVTLNNAGAQLLPAQSGPQTGASMRDSTLADTPSALIYAVPPSR